MFKKLLSLFTKSNNNENYDPFLIAYHVWLPQIRHIISEIDQGHMYNVRSIDFISFEDISNSIFQSGNKEEKDFIQKLNALYIKSNNYLFDAALASLYEDTQLEKTINDKALIKLREMQELIMTQYNIFSTPIKTLHETEHYKLKRKYGIK